MAKFKKLALVCASVMALSTVIAATACDPVESTSSSGTPEPAHVHTFGETQTWSKDATDHWYACTDAECDLKIGKQAHAWNEGEVTTEATEEADGVKTYTCTVCAQTKTEPIAKIVYDEPASGEGTEESPFVVTDGSYKIPFTYDEEMFSAGYVYATYTVVADGTVTVSYNEFDAVFLYVNGTLVETNAGENKIPVNADDVITSMIGVSWEYNWEEAESNEYVVYLNVSSSDEIMEANGSALLPWTVTMAEIQENYGSVSYEYDVEVSDYVYVNYTVTGETTKGLWVSSASAITGVQVVNNYGFALQGGYNEDYSTKTAYLAVTPGETVCFQLSPTEYSVYKAELSFGLEETSEDYEDGTTAYPYIVATAGESFTNILVPAGFRGFPGEVYFVYIATENGTLTINSDNLNMVLQGCSDAEWNNPEVTDASTTEMFVQSFEVTAGSVYTIVLTYNSMAYEAGVTTISPTFTFTAATAA